MKKGVEVIYDMPLAEVLFDFYDKLKSVSRGYASFDYELKGFKTTDLVKTRYTCKRNCCRCPFNAGIP